MWFLPKHKQIPSIYRTKGRTHQWYNRIIPAEKQKASQAASSSVFPEKAWQNKHKRDIPQLHTQI
jgi:hypothetical protein